MDPDYSIDGLIKYFEMAHKVMGYGDTKDSYQYHVAEMLKKLRTERDEARRQAICGWSMHMSRKEMKQELKKQGWEGFNLD